MGKGGQRGRVGYERTGTEYKVVPFPHLSVHSPQYFSVHLQYHATLPETPAGTP